MDLSSLGDLGGLGGGLGGGGGSSKLATSRAEANTTFGNRGINTVPLDGGSTGGPITMIVGVGALLAIVLLAARN